MKKQNYLPGISAMGFLFSVKQLPVSCRNPLGPENAARAGGTQIVVVHLCRTICMSHLSRPGRFKMFFDVIKRVLTGEIEIFAAGANPPEPIDTGKGTFNYTALRNAYIVTHWAGQFTPTTENACGDIKRLTLRLGEGDPSIKEIIWIVSVY